VAKSFFKKEHLCLFLLLAFTFLVFYPSLSCEFTNWDDNWMITDNPLIRSLSFSNLNELLFGEIYMLNYQPLVFLSYSLEYHFFGLDAGVFHFTNVMLHLLNVLLVYLFIKLLSGNNTVAFIAAILFAIHPMRVESVTWVTNRRDLLYTFFYVLSLVQYVKYQKLDKSKQQTKHYVLALLFFIFSCMSKGMAVSLSLVVVLIDFLREREINRTAILDKIPFLVVSLFFGSIAFYATHDQQQIEMYDAYTLLERLQFASYGLLFYLYKFLLPLNLSSFHPYPLYTSGALPVLYWLFPLVCLLIAGLVIYSLKHTRKIFFGFGFFLVAVVMVLQLFPVYNGIVAERYTYVSYIGLFFLAGEGYYLLLGLEKGKYKQVLMVSGITVLLALSYLSHQRTKVWQNSLTLWSDVIRKYPDSPAGYMNRGQYYSEHNELTDALRDYSRAITVSPNALAYSNRGNIYARMKEFDKAIEDYTNAIKIKSEDVKTYLNMGLVYYYKKDYHAAIKNYNMAIKLNPDNGIGYINRSLAYDAIDKRTNALQDALSAHKLGQKVNEEYLLRLKNDN